MRGDAAPRRPRRGNERLDAARLDEHVVVEQHHVLRSFGERLAEPCVGAAREAAVVAQRGRRSCRPGSSDAGAVPGLVVDEHAPHARSDLREAVETGAGALAGAPCDDDRSNAHRCRV